MLAFFLSDGLAVGTIQKIETSSWEDDSDVNFKKMPYGYMHDILEHKTRKMELLLQTQAEVGIINTIKEILSF